MFGNVGCRLPLIPVKSHARRIPRRPSARMPAILPLSQALCAGLLSDSKLDLSACPGRVTVLRVSGPAVGRVRLHPPG